MLLQTHKTALRPLTTAHLAQTMSLLALTGDELRQKLDAALASNPALELTEERRCSQCNRRLRGDGPCPVCSSPRNSSKDEPIIFVSSRSDFHTGYQASNEDDSSMEEWTAAVEDLPTFVLRQIAPDLPVEDRGIAAYILNSLDEDGLLRIPLIEIARYHHATLSRVQSVISLIQRAEPIGVGSSNPQEASEGRVDAWRRGIELIASVIAQAMSEGAARQGDPILSARLMVAMQQVFMSAWVESGMSENPDDLADRIEEQIRRSLFRSNK